MITGLNKVVDKYNPIAYTTDCESFEKAGIPLLP